MTASLAAPLAPDLEAALRRLKLAAVRRLAPELRVTAKVQRWAPDELLRTLLEAELAARDASNASARLRAAGFPVTRTLDGFDLSESSIPRATFDYLASLEWVRAAENLVLVGPAGTGKTVCRDRRPAQGDTGAASDTNEAPRVPLATEPQGRWRPAWPAYRGSTSWSSPISGGRDRMRCPSAAAAAGGLVRSSGGAATGAGCARRSVSIASRCAGSAVAPAATLPACCLASRSAGTATRDR